MTIKALTIWRPWPLAIFRLGKDIENRTWPPPDWLLGKRIAIHAGKRFDARGSDYILEAAGLQSLPREFYVAGSFVGTVVLESYRKLEGSPRDDPSPWAVGPYCWHLTDPIQLSRPVRCRGQQGLWDVPGRVMKLIEAQGAA